MARAPEIIRRNPLSQVAPQSAPAGQGFKALADLAGMAAEFVKPAAIDQVKRKGEDSVYRDEKGVLKVETRSLYSGEMGAIQNQAALTSYLSKKTIDINATMAELATKYEFDPEGFGQATKSYVKTLSGDPNVPDAIKSDVVRSVEEGAARQFNGLQRAQIDRTYKEADTESNTARDLLMDDYVSLVVAGDDDAAASKWEEIEQISRMRANAPYITETPAETEALMRGARGTAKAARLLRDLTDLEGADEISDEQRAGLEEVLKDPDLTPATRQRLYVATRGRLKGIDAAGMVKNLTNDSYSSMVVRAESGGNDKAKAATSSAYGPHQFLKGTWAGLVKKYKPEWANGLSEIQIQSMRGDRAKSTEMFAHFRRENQDVLTRAGQPVNPATEYMAHFFGAGTAVKVLGADPSASLADVVPQATINANKFLQGMTVRDAQNWAARKMTMKSTDIAATGIQARQIEDPEVRRLVLQGINARIADRRAIEVAAANVFEERLAMGDTSLTDQEISENHDLSTDDQVRLTSALDKVNKQTDEMQEIVSRINDPDGAFVPTDTKDRKDLNKVADALIGDKPAMSPEALGIADDLAKRTGIIPDKVADGVRAGVQSSDPAVVGGALETLAQLKASAGDSLASVTGQKGLENTLSDYEFYGQFMGSDEAAQRLIDNREKKPKNVTDEAKEAAKALDISDVTDSFDQSVFSTPQVGDDRAGEKSQPLLSGPQENEMMAEYTQLFKDAYMDTGDAALSKNRALNEMGRIYGVNGVSGKGRVMKFPPNKVYAPVAGSHDWMQEQLVSEVNEFFGLEGADEAALGDGFLTRVGESANEFLGHDNHGAIRGSQISLVSDAQTAAEVKAGRPASYTVYAMRDGVLEQVPQRFTFDPGPAKAAARERFNRGQLDRARITTQFRNNSTPDPDYLANVKKHGPDVADQMQQEFQRQSTGNFQR